MIMLEFEGIDYWNRPVFKHDSSEARVGSTDRLCSMADVDDVVEKLEKSDLCYFGSEFGCEPIGTPLKADAEVELRYKGQSRLL